MIIYLSVMRESFTRDDDDASVQPSVRSPMVNRSCLQSISIHFVVTVHIGFSFCY